MTIYKWERTVQQRRITSPLNDTLNRSSDLTILIIKLRPNREINIKRDTMKQLITIFKNLGTIVILLFQVAYVATIDYIRPHDNAKPKQNHQYTSIDKIDKHEIL